MGCRPSTTAAFARRPQSVPAIQKAVYDRFPTITVVNMADVLDTIQSVVDQISLVVRFISGVLDSGGRDHSGVERGGHALPAYSRSGDSEDAGRDAEGALRRFSRSSFS